MDVTVGSSAGTRTPLRGGDYDCAGVVDTVVDPPAEGLEGGEDEEEQADQGVWVRPDGVVVLGAEGEPDAEAGSGDVDEVCGDLGEDVEFEHDGVVDVEAEEDGADGEEEGPCYCAQNGVGDQYVASLDGGGGGGW